MRMKIYILIGLVSSIFLLINLFFELMSLGLGIFGVSQQQRARRDLRLSRRRAEARSRELEQEQERATAEAERVRAAELVELRQRKGRRSTITTGAQGLGGPAPVIRRTLLGT